MSPQDAPTISYIVTFLIVGGVVFFRYRRLSQGRPLRLERLWILPAIFVVMTAATFVQMPPVGMDWAILLAPLALGGVVGWYRGKMMRITVDPETHALNQSASPWALLFLLAIMAIRMGLRTLLMGSGHPEYIHLGVDGLMVFAAGMFAVMRLEMWIRARRLLAEARAAKAVANG